MTPSVREMTVVEFDLIIEYFLGSTPEHLEMLGVDPMWLPAPEAWRERFRRESALPIERRAWIIVIWLLDNRPVGFSTSDKITFSEQANMHLHVTDAERRHQGIGSGMRAAQLRHLFRTAEVETAFLRAKCLQCRAQSRAAEGRIQISQDLYDLSLIHISEPTRPY